MRFVKRKIVPFRKQKAVHIRHVNALAEAVPDILKETALWLLSAVAAVSIGIYIYQICTTDLHITAYVNGTRIGIVSSVEDMEEAAQRLRARFAPDDAYGLTYRTAYTFIGKAEQDVSVMDADDCYIALYNYTGQNCTEAYALSLNGSCIACLENYADVCYVKERLKIGLSQQLQSIDESIAGVTLLESYTCERVLCDRSRIESADTVYNRLLSSYQPDANTQTDTSSTPPRQEQQADTEGTHRISSYTDENTYYLGLKNDVNLLAGVSSVTEGTGSAGQMLSSLIGTYKTYKNITETKILPYETQIIESDEYYVGTVITEVAGETGVSESVYLVEYLAGEETARSLISETVVSAPVACVQIVGTKEYPKPIPTGTFAWPLYHPIITSSFGWRPDPFTGESRFHLGLDLYEPAGSPIYASDGGVVAEATYSDAYGIYVLIDHGNGMRTRYAHMSKRLVEAGDRVYQGQEIGKVGMTGRATGYHCHFELIINGSVVQPLDYLPELK